VTTCTPPQRAVVNQFLCGQVKVGQGQTDPQCGTALCGYTQMGRWHEYMCQTPLGLSGQLPSVLIVVDPTAIPQAIIGLGPEVPQIHITPDPLVVPAAALALTGRLPGLITNSTLAVTGTGLGLGADIPVFVGQEWLGDSVCTDLPLAAAGSSDLVLVAAGSTDLDLDPVECR
jgi:hypothetical protein